MSQIKFRIAGVPYPKRKNASGKEGLRVWTKCVVENSASLPRVTGPCSLRVTFFLPPDKFPTDFPFGSDLDNLLKPFLDALQETVFSKVTNGDSCIMELNASKVKVDAIENCGVSCEIVQNELLSQAKHIIRPAKPHLAIEGNRIYIEADTWVVPTNNQSQIHNLLPELTGRLGKLTSKYPKSREDVHRFVESVERILA
jgi:Holliday junction resolvase RusA-like endonuclease